MTERYSYFFMFLVLLLLGCATGKKPLEKGDYQTAIRKAVKRLKSNPYNEKSKTALIDGYWLYSNLLDQGIADLKRTDKTFKWEDIASKYGQLNYTYDLIQTCPACKEVVGYAKKYPKEEEEAKQKAASERFAAGEASLKENTRESAKRAYFHFQKVNQYNPSYIGLNKIMAEAKERATIRVLVQNTSKNEERGDYFFRKVMEGVLNDNRNQFVAFYEEDVPDAHQKLEIGLDHFSISHPKLLKTKEELHSDSVVVGKVKEDSVYKEVMGVVYADYFTYEKRMDAEGKGSIKISDLSTGETLSVKTYPMDQKWSTIWASFNGDKRALTKEEYELTNISEPPAPSPEYFYDLISESLGAKLSKHVERFYSGY